jgi:hypothetical protein
LAVSSKHTGWRWDKNNSRLDFYYQGTRVGHIDANGLTVASGLTLAVTTADKLTVGGVIAPQDETVQSAIIDATYDQDRFIWTAPWACTVTKIEFQQSAIENTSSTSTVMVNKVPSGTAPASGTNLLAAALNLKTGVTANTKAAPALHGTAANLVLAAGDSIGLDFTNALTEYVGCVTVTVKRS